MFVEPSKSLDEWQGIGPIHTEGGTPAGDTSCARRGRLAPRPCLRAVGGRGSVSECGVRAPLGKATTRPAFGGGSPQSGTILPHFKTLARSGRTKTRPKLGHEPAEGRRGGSLVRHGRSLVRRGKPTFPRGKEVLRRAGNLLGRGINSLALAQNSVRFGNNPLPGGSKFLPDGSHFRQSGSPLLPSGQGLLPLGQGLVRLGQYLVRGGESILDGENTLSILD